MPLRKLGLSCRGIDGKSSEAKAAKLEGIALPASQSDAARFIGGKVESCLPSHQLPLSLTSAHFSSTSSSSRSSVSTSSLSPSTPSLPLLRSPPSPIRRRYRSLRRRLSFSFIPRRTSHSVSTSSSSQIRCSIDESLKVMISGAPASGKGTQCELIVQKWRAFAFIFGTLYLSLNFQILICGAKMEDDGGERSSFVAGLIENRAKEVGMAAFDLRSASLHLSQYIETSSSYQNTKTLLRFYDPSVTIVPPNKLAADGMVGVSELVDRCYSYSRINWGYECICLFKLGIRMHMSFLGRLRLLVGAVLIQNLAAEEPLALGLDTYYKQHYLSLAAAAATIKWIEAEKGVIVTNHSLTVTFNGSFDHMNIDATSVENLVIIDPFHNALLGTSNKKRSLFQMFKTTKTVGGTRLLRANLLQPLKDIETINTRLDCLDELMSNEQLFFGISQSNVLHVKNLSFKTTDEGLKKHLTKLVKQGKILSVKIIKHVKNGKNLSSGYGFVEFDSVETATNVYRDLQGTVLDGHALILRFCENKRSDKAGKDSGKDKPSTKLHVKNVAFEATKKELKQLFSPFGQIKSMRLPKRNIEQYAGFAFVEFVTKQEALNAKKALSSTHFYGRHLVLEWANDDNSMEAIRKRSAAKLDEENDNAKKRKSSKAVDEGKNEV
ncbi:RNA recognition motif domain [Arabidopsis suecica]|uniref:RNA recognition motif domain n=1 Tax=Arabidopsis suecica TaxID=45249 RepID=A0A8T1YLX9_ARASU|nr:RNA recognition motif domain [Arabidopsis suecica]